MACSAPGRVLFLGLLWVGLTAYHANAGGARGLASPFHPLTNVNIFAVDENDPRSVESRLSEGRHLAAIGLVAPVSPIPSVDPKNVDELNNRILQRGSSTGFLISPCHLLTNYHAVFGHSTDPSSTKTAFVYLVSLVKGSYFKTVGTPVQWGNYVEEGANGFLSTAPAQDWAVLRLERCLGFELGWFRLSDRSDAEALSLPVNLSGYPADRSRKFLWTHKDCRLHALGTNNYLNTFYHDCAVVPGASGSPLYWVTNGEIEVIAMQSRSRNPTTTIQKVYSFRRANIAIDLRYVAEKIRHLLSPAPSENPLQ
jgi:V8-like Glu-specific endopeptidase